MNTDQNTDQAIKNFNLTGRVMKISTLCPWSSTDLFFIVNIQTVSNLIKRQGKVVVLHSHYAEIVNIANGKPLVVEIDNGFALTLFSERK